MKDALILTLDVGTTSLKGALVDISGSLLALRIQEYELEKPAPDRVEVDPDVYWSSAKKVIAEILAESAVDPRRIAALGITGQGETLIVTDTSGRPLRKALVWLDNRAVAEAEAIKAEFGRDEVYRVTGQQDIVPGWTAAKILWLRNNEPDTFKAAAKFLMVEDYLVFCLTGKYATDHALNSSTLYYDVPHACWWQRMLDFLQVSESHLPTLLNSGEAAGNIVADIGLASSTLVTVAPIDQISAAVGAGNIAPGMVTETTGSVMAICATVGEMVYDPLKRIGLYRHAIPGRYVLLPWVPTAGMALRWFRDEFAPGTDYASLTDAAATIPPGCEGLLLLPHLNGMVNPDINPDARGVFFGISLSHRKPHFVRAVLEAVAYSLRDNVEALEEMGVECTQLVSLGGAARSALWLQIKSDVLGRPLSVMDNEETTSLGCAVLAAAGTGLYGSVEEAIKGMVVSGRSVVPNPENHTVYDSRFKKYKELNRLLFLASD